MMKSLRKLLRPDERLPSVGEQFGNVLSAGARAVGAAIRGKSIVVPPEVLKEREAICAGCEENLSGRCRKCGCGVRSQLIRKTHLATERCPLNPPRWIEYS